MATPTQVTLTGRDLTLAEVMAVARAGAHVRVDPAAVERMTAARAVVDGGAHGG